jgi:NADH-quinone oxidoreductase subunit L
MFLGLGVGAFTAGIFHVFTHAFFKGCLFLCAGSVIHALHHEQDMFNMGGLKKYMPKTATTYLIACLAIAGVPGLSGFFSKDEILWYTFHHGYTALWIVGMITAFITAFYMFRSWFLSFTGEERIDPHKKEHLHESPASMTIPLIILAAGSIFAGLFNIPAVLWDGQFSAWLHHFLEPVTGAGEGVLERMQIHPFKIVGDHGTEKMLMVVSSLVALAGIGTAWIAAKSGFFIRQEKKQSALYKFSRNAWFWDAAYNNSFAKGCYEMARLVLAFDKLIIDGIVNGAGWVARQCGTGLRRMQNGQVQNYALIMLIGVNAILILTFYLIFGIK